MAFMRSNMKPYAAMRFDLRHIRAFVLLAEELHFRRAAERLFMTQPGLSRIIRSLEEELGVELLLRTTRSVELTEAGAAFLVECQETLAQLERGIMRTRSVALGDSGSVVVAYSDFAINGPLPQILEIFRRENPGIRIELSYMPTVDQKQAILTGDIDVGLLMGPVQIKGISSLSVIRDPLVVLLPDKHPLAQHEAVSILDLANEPFILGSNRSWVTFRRVVFDLCQRLGFSPIVVQEASTSDGILGLVSANIGISLYSACARNIQRRGMTTRPLAGVNYEVETLAIWRSEGASPSIQRFIRSLEDTVKQLRPS